MIEGVSANNLEWQRNYYFSSFTENNRIVNIFNKELPKSPWSLSPSHTATGERHIRCHYGQTLEVEPITSLIPSSKNSAA